MRAQHRPGDEETTQETHQQADGRHRSPWFSLARQGIFWLHLVTGTLTGLIIAVMACTGVLLAWERPVLRWAERALQTIPLPTAIPPRLSLDAVLAPLQEAGTTSTLHSVTLRADPAATVMVHVGQERMLFVNPYTGLVVGEGATALRRFFHLLTDWHRQLGLEGESRDVGRAITGACNAAFVGMILTGLVLWWPRRWTPQALKAVLVPGLRLRGKARAWNWHHTVGFWTAPVLLCLTCTGLVISYPWANDLLYILTGSPKPARPALPTAGRTGDAGRRANQPAQASFETLLAAASRQAPHWQSLTMRLPQRGSTRLTIFIEEAGTPHPSPRSLLTLDAATAAVQQWEPYAGYSLGRTLRAWVRPVHTGEAGGLIGQGVVSLASAGGLLLVWTGLALAWRRFRARPPLARRSPPSTPTL